MERVNPPLWIQSARTVFAALYGEKKGRAVCDAVIPGVLGDFRGMLDRAEPGAVVRETYRLDDKKGDILLEGCRTAEGRRLTRLDVAGRSVDLGADGAVI